MKPVLDNPHDDYLDRNWDKMDYCIIDIKFDSNILKIEFCEVKRKKKEKKEKKKREEELCPVPYLECLIIRHL